MNVIARHFADEVCAVIGAGRYVIQVQARGGVLVARRPRHHGDGSNLLLVSAPPSELGCLVGKVIKNMPPRWGSELEE